MSRPPEFQQAFDDLINRLAAESVLARPGSDEGLLPAFSLLADLRELCSGLVPLHAAFAELRAVLEARLDAAQPFDEPTLGRLRQFVDWLPGAVGGAASVSPPPPVVGASAATAAAAAAPHDAADELLQLDLENNRELLVEFHGEAVEHLDQIEAALLVLDQHPDDREALAAMFRSFHTIKGNAGFLGLRPMHVLAHEVESLLDLARSGQLRLTEAIISEILRSRDALQALAAQVDAALHQGRLPDVVVPVSHLVDAVTALAATGVATAATPKPAEPIAPLPAAPPVATAERPPPAVETVAAKPAAGGAAAAATVRVNTEKLDTLMDVVGELVIVQSQLAESGRGATDAALLRNLGQLGRITKELQHTALSLRMIPIKSTFQKMERLARDLARQCGKQVVLTTGGDETELDRTVVEEIADPLVHMVRNALDHGIESAADRAAAGKNPAGSLHLEAYHQGSFIVIELRDDGRGLDCDRIRRKAVEQGLVAAETQLSRDEIHALIFAPGFSTAAKVTEVSGRGVGMDVVKRNVEKLRGTVEIASEPGRGSVFKIKLPLTMAIIDGLVVRVGADRFILPSTSVQMALRPAREHVSTLHGDGEVLDLRGKLLPIHRLHQRFGITADAAQPWEGIVVIVEFSGKACALMVDEMVTKQEVVIKSLGAFLRHVPGVSGGAILGDGNIALILDPGTLLNAA